MNPFYYIDLQNLHYFATGEGSISDLNSPYHIDLILNLLLDLARLYPDGQRKKIYPV